MPDFTVAFDSGVAPEPWEDPGLGDIPSRINFDAEHPQVRLVATVGVLVVFQATVDGVLAPLDVALGGRLFAVTMAEYPTPSPVSVNGVVARSAIQSFTPNAAGHYTFVMRREDGGGIWLHIDARDP